MSLTFSLWRLLSYRNQSIDLQSKSMDWFLYDNGLRHETVKYTKKVLWKNFTFCGYCDRCFGKKCSVSCIFQTIVVIVVMKILEKHWWRKSVLERNSLLVYLYRIFQPQIIILFWRTIPYAESAPCSILVDNA